MLATNPCVGEKHCRAVRPRPLFAALCSAWLCGPDVCYPRSIRPRRRQRVSIRRPAPSQPPRSGVAPTTRARRCHHRCQPLNRKAPQQWVDHRARLRRPLQAWPLIPPRTQVRARQPLRVQVPEAQWPPQVVPAELVRLELCAAWTRNANREAVSESVRSQACTIAAVTLTGTADPISAATQVRASVERVNSAQRTPTATWENASQARARIHSRWVVHARRTRGA